MVAPRQARCAPGWPGTLAPGGVWGFALFASQGIMPPAASERSVSSGTDDGSVREQRQPPGTGRDVILDQAGRQRSALGTDGVSIRDLARVCRVFDGAIYYHLDSKQELYIQVLNAPLTRVTGSLTAAEPPRTRSLPSRPSGSCQAQLALVAFRDLSSVGDEVIERLTPQPQTRIPSKMEEGRRDGVPAGQVRPAGLALAAKLLQGMFNVPASQPLLGRRDDPDHERAQCVVEVLAGDVAVTSKGSRSAPRRPHHRHRHSEIDCTVQPRSKTDGSIV